MKRLRRKFERKTGIIFGYFRTVESSRADYRFVLRIGFGRKRELVTSELGILSHSIYVTRIQK